MVKFSAFLIMRSVFLYMVWTESKKHCARITSQSNCYVIETSLQCVQSNSNSICSQFEITQVLGKHVRALIPVTIYISVMEFTCHGFLSHKISICRVFWYPKNASVLTTVQWHGENWSRKVGEKSVRFKGHGRMSDNLYKVQKTV